MNVMKTILRFISVIIFISTLSLQVEAQEKATKIDTVNFEVKGVCGMCKDRIENAALLKGVKWVEWDKETNTLTVIYRKDKIDILKVHESIAKSGHTTELVECDLEAYKKLPACCAYMDGAEKH